MSSTNMLIVSVYICFGLLYGPLVAFKIHPGIQTVIAIMLSIGYHLLAIG